MGIELYSAKGIKEYWDEIYEDGMGAKEVTTYINFNRKCSHIRKVLEEQDLVNGTDRRLLTGKEYQKISDEQMEE